MKHDSGMYTGKQPREAIGFLCPGKMAVFGIAGLRESCRVEDPDTGFYYSNARWYDAELGRFITGDLIKDGLNWYGYCENNPVNNIDPSGLLSQSNQDALNNSLANYTPYSTGTYMSYEDYAAQCTDYYNNLEHQAILDTEKQIKDLEDNFDPYDASEAIAVNDLRKQLLQQKTDYYNDGSHSLMFEILDNTVNGMKINLKDVQIILNHPATKKEILVGLVGISLGLTTAEMDALYAEMQGRAISLPNGFIYMPYNLTNDIDKISVSIHEYFHQFQFLQTGKQAGFGLFLGEQKQYNQYNAERTLAINAARLSNPIPAITTINPYNVDANITPGLTRSTINTINDILTLEAQAKYIEEFSVGYLKAKKNSNFSNPYLKKQAQVLAASGYSSIAIKKF